MLPTYIDIFARNSVCWFTTYLCTEKWKNSFSKKFHGRSIFAAHWPYIRRSETLTLRWDVNVLGKSRLKIDYRLTTCRQQAICARTSQCRKNEMTIACRSIVGFTAQDNLALLTEGWWSLLEVIPSLLTFIVEIMKVWLPGVRFHVGHEVRSFTRLYVAVYGLPRPTANMATTDSCQSPVAVLQLLEVQEEDIPWNLYITWHHSY